MMNLDERMAEIHRRSEIILQTRKHRKRMILTCVPILLCVCAVFSLGDIGRLTDGEVIGGDNGGYFGNNGLGRPESETVGEGMTENIEMIVIEIASEDAQRAEDLLRQIIRESQTQDGGSDMSGDMRDDELRKVYLIRIVRSDDTIVSYDLWGRSLNDHEREESYTITAAQRAAILEALNIGNGQ